MIKRLRKLNRVLPELLAGILGYGLIVLGFGMFFSHDKLKFAVGLGTGIACSVFMAYHMAVSIEDAVSINDEKHAKNISVTGSVIRYAVVLAVFAVMLYFKAGSLIACFLGLMGLKVSAYLQPFFHTVKNDPDRLVPPEEQDELLKEQRRNK